MQIALNQNEIEAGIKMYIESRGISLSGREVSMDFTAQRKGNAGINVDVDLGEDSFFSPSANQEDSPNKQSNTVVTLTGNGGVSAKRSPAPVVTLAPTVLPEEAAAAEQVETEEAPVKRSRAKAKPAEPVEEASPVEEETQEAPPSELAQPVPDETPIVANPNSLFGGATVASAPAVANDPVVTATEPVMSKSLFG